MSASNFILLLLVLAGIFLFVGLLSARRIESQADYFLAGRKVGVLALTMTLLATQIGGGVMIGTSNAAYHIGLYAILLSLGNFLSFMLLASGFASRLRSFNIVTTAQLFETHYHSPGLRKFASLLIVLAMLGMLVAQVVASKHLLTTFAIDSTWVFVMFWAFIIVYTMVGGLRAVIVTDVYQVIAIIIICMLLFIPILIQYSPLSLRWLEPQSITQFPVNAWELLLFPLFFCIIEQDLAQRCFAARSTQVASRAMLFSGVIFLLFSIIPIYFGVLAHHLLAKGQNLQGSAMLSVLQHIGHPVLVMLLSLALLIAIVSTADSLICAISSNLAQDFSLSSSRKQTLALSRFVTLCVGVLALIIGMHFDNVVSILIHSQELPVCSLFVAIFVCCIKKKVDKLAAMGSVGSGFMSYFLFKWLAWSRGGVFFSLLMAVLGYVCGWLWSRTSLINRQVLPRA